MSGDLFRGAVPYYVRYRVPYPEPLLAEILTRGGSTGTGRLLDLGCGTGEIALRLAKHFKDVNAIDVDTEMLTAAKQKASEQRIHNVTWQCQPAEQWTAESNSYELVTIGAAYHWMDRALIARRVRDWLEPGQPLVVLGYSSIWSGTAEWLPIVRQVIHRWLGEKRRAGSGEYPEAAEPHELVLLKAGYMLEEIKYQHRQTWTLDELIGNLYSTSFASPAVLGDRQAEFEADLRQTMLEYESSGTYAEEMTFYALVATP